MTDTGSSLLCPECGNAITAAQLAADGLCEDCVDRFTESIPTPTAIPAQADAVDLVEPAPPDDAGEVTGDGAGDEENTDALAALLTSTVGLVIGADYARSLLPNVEGDQVCNDFGNFLDGVVVAGERLLDHYVPDWRAMTKGEAE